MIDDFEIRNFSMLGAHDSQGRRVWAGANHFEESRPEHLKWTVYHRAKKDERWPVSLIHVATFEDALRTARALVQAYSEEPSR
jgi:hypothetical protein